jgi:predicted ATPase
MLTEMRLKNFKSWKDTGDMRLAPNTGFFGTNSSGKTSLLQALLLLKQSVDTSDPNQVLDFGGNRNRDIVHCHHLLRRLQRRRAEETLSEKEVALHFCAQREEAPLATRLDINDSHYAVPLKPGVALPLPLP